MKKFLFVLSFIMGIIILSVKAFSQISVEISITANTPPPELPEYIQPECPEDGFMWTPGYWGYGDDGYYWVPGFWVSPPQPGYLWTPCYWGLIGGIYSWNRGYWGEHVGFYGGVNYGYGYGGHGFGGGRWDRGRFRYNAAVMNVNRTVIHNTYIDRTVIAHRSINNRTSFNGGDHGTKATPSERERFTMKETHIAPTGNQAFHEQNAARDKNQFASANHGRPITTSMNTVGGNRFGMKGHAIVGAAPVSKQQSDFNNRNQRTNNSGQKPIRPSIASPITHQAIPQVKQSNRNVNGGDHLPNTNQQSQPILTQPIRHTPFTQQHTQPFLQPQQHVIPQKQSLQPQQQRPTSPQQHNQPQQPQPQHATPQQKPHLLEGGNHKPR